MDHFGPFWPKKRSILVHLWGIILKPQPPHTRKKNEQKYGCETVEFALFAAFWVIFSPDFCLYFCLVCGGGGHSRVSEFRSANRTLAIPELKVATQQTLDEHPSC